MKINSVIWYDRLYNFQFETPFAAIYSMTTAALDKWTRNDSQRLAKLGIRINSILPGPIETNITNNGIPHGMDKNQIRETVTNFHFLFLKQ